MEERARGRRRRVVIAVGVVFATVVLAALGWLVYYRANFGTFAWWQIPPRIEYCGREYDRAPTTVSPASLNGKLVQVMTIEPAGRAVYTLRTADSGTTTGAGLPCTMGLIVIQGDQYLQYGLSGGP